MFDKALLAVLVCPVSKRGVALLDARRLKALNNLIADGAVCSLDGTLITERLEAALITDNHTTIYPIVDGVAVMIEGKGISFGDLD